jgi:hypothetical protein
MIELLIAAVAIVAFFLYLKVNKDKKQTQAPVNTTDNINPVVHAEVEKETAPEPTIETTAQTKTAKLAIPAQKTCTDNGPQDSTLRRHTLSHLTAMIEAINGSRPADSSLSRHYDSLINAQLDNCLNDKTAMDQLVCIYEGLKKTVVQAQTKPVTATAKPVTKAKDEPKANLVQSDNLPTDSTLRRHYETMLNNK